MPFEEFSCFVVSQILFLNEQICERFNLKGEKFCEKSIKTENFVKG